MAGAAHAQQHPAPQDPVRAPCGSWRAARRSACAGGLSFWPVRLLKAQLSSGPMPWRCLSGGTDCGHCVQSCAAALCAGTNNALLRRRCQAAPEAGGGGSLFNLRAWGAGVVSGLKLGQAEAPRDAPGESDDEDDAQLPPALLAPGEQSSWDEWQQVGVREPDVHARLDVVWPSASERSIDSPLQLPGPGIRHCCAGSRIMQGMAGWATLIK